MKSDVKDVISLLEGIRNDRQEIQGQGKRVERVAIKSGGKEVSEVSGGLPGPELPVRHPTPDVGDRAGGEAGGGGGRVRGVRNETTGRPSPVGLELPDEGLGRRGVGGRDITEVTRDAGRRGESTIGRTPDETTVGRETLPDIQLGAEGQPLFERRADYDKKTYQNARKQLDLFSDGVSVSRTRRGVGDRGRGDSGIKTIGVGIRRDLIR